MPETPLHAAASIMKPEYRIPSITAYNRLEPNPRTPDFSRSLKAEVRDPLWMLTRQWQFGEFLGEDAGSPVTAQILGEHTVMDRVGFPGDRVFRYDEQIPLETAVERETLRPNLYLALQVARYFIKLLKSKALDAYAGKFAAKYPLNVTIDKNDYEGRQMLHAVKGTYFDGFTLYLDIITKDGGEVQTRFAKWLDAAGNSDIFPADKIKINEAADVLRKWFLRMYCQPDKAEDSAWLPAQLEYQFTLASPLQQQQKVLAADQYYEGRLDWFSFDLDSSKRLSLGPEPAVPNGSVSENFVSFIPAPIAFKGMPNPRFWAMEENQTDFGKIDTSTTGLLHLLFAEFGLIYSNDWFMLPYPLSINTVCEIKGIVITDVFGLHVLVRPAGRGPESNWQRWSMFHHADKSNVGSITNLFYLPPALTKVLEGEPLEKVNFVRDEMANMVWAVENIVPSQAGKGVNANEIAIKEKEQETFIPSGEAKIRYVLGTTLPDNWVPFIPVHMGGDMEIRLQRAKLPGSKGAMSTLLTEKPAPYFINEEEVPRAGVTVQRSFQRARWINGKTYLWIGRYKESGAGEGWSNLRFDQIEPIEK